jgi:hypothetical protein
MQTARTPPLRRFFRTCGFAAQLLLQAVAYVLVLLLWVLPVCILSQTGKLFAKFSQVRYFTFSRDGRSSVP